MKLYKIKVLMFVLITLVAGNNILAQSKAVINPMAYDFGDIVQDSIVTKVFEITNTGDQLLKIIDIKASCGCTAVVAGKKELKPGESTDIKASFDSKGKTGKQNKTITVSTNDPQNPAIKLAFTGNVVNKDLTNKKGEHSKSTMDKH